MKNLRNPKFLFSVFLGIYFLMLLFNINKIPIFSGDEKIYRTSVESMMDGHVDANNHPLLAKTIWLLTVDLFYIITGTDMPLFWRFGTILFSIMNLIIFYKICRIYFTQGIALVAAVLLAVDPMYFVFSRSMQLEVIMLFWALLGLYYFLIHQKKKKSTYINLGAFFMGLSLSSKLSALLLVAVLPFFLIKLRLNKSKEFLKSAVIFYLIALLGFLLGNLPFFVLDRNVASFIQYNWALISEQFGKTGQTGIFQTSVPLTWFFIPQILSMYRIDLIDKVNAIIAFQNPATFLISAFTLIMTAIGLIKKNIKDNKNTILMVVYILGFYLPWLPGIRITYYYYFLPLIPLIIILFIKLILPLPSRKIILFIFLCVNIGFFGLYFPLLTGIEVRKSYDLNLYKYSQYYYPEINRLFCQNCYPRR